MRLEIFKHNGNGLVVSSRVIAKGLGKRHDSILRDIDNIVKNQSPQICGNLIGTNLSRLIYLSNYKDSKNRTYREYLLTKDGFILYMFNIQGHIDFKITYINEFNRMEKELKEKQSLPFKKEEEKGVKLMRQIYEAKERVQNSLNEYKLLLLSNKAMIENELLDIKNSGFKTHKIQSYFNGSEYCLRKSLTEFE